MSSMPRIASASARSSVRCQARIVRSLRPLACAALLAGAAAGHVHAQSTASSPSAELYEKVSVNRNRHSGVIWGDNPASAEDIRDIIRTLESDLAAMEEPLPRELAEGNVYLRYRRYNILVDLVRLHARIGESDRALARWRELMTFQWSALPGALQKTADGTGTGIGDVAIRSLKELPGYAEIARQKRVAEWWSNAPSLRTAHRAQLPVDERIAGVSLIWSKARDGFVWFDHVPDLDWDRAYRETLAEAIAAPDTLTYYRVLERFVARLQDGHSNVYLPEPLRSHQARPGLRTRMVEGKVVVVSIADAGLVEAGLKVGDELLAIDGQPVRDYAERTIRPYVGASTPQDMAVRMFEYRLLAGEEAKPAALRFSGANGRTFDVAAPRSGYRTGPKPADVPLFRLRDDGIAVLRAAQFENDASARALGESFEQMGNARGLIVDLRGNGGGNTSHGLKILMHLTRERIPSMRSYYRENVPFNAASSSVPSDTWRRILESDSASTETRQFDGPVVVLIDARTFSAAEDTAAIFRLMRRGTIIGMPSGGSTGQPLLFDLPGGGKARICVKRDTYPDGTTFVGSGVQPDIEVAETIEDIRTGRDGALDRAVAEILGSGPR